MKRLLTALLVLLLFASSCREPDTLFLKEDNLFSLRYGKMDDQLDMTSGKSINTAIPALVRMANGIIYVMNGNLHKIMKFTSYGDLLSVLGRRENLSGASLVEENINENERVNRKAVHFPFNNIEEFAVDERQYLYVSDLLPNERHEWDDEAEAMLTNIIYRFDNNCAFIDSIGQDGRGGMPFPFIKNISVNENHEFVVVTFTGARHIVFWFSSEGDLMYRVEIDNDKIPYPAGERDLEAAVTEIKPSPGSKNLYIKVDYYENTINEATGAVTDIDFFKSYINVLDLETENYTAMIEIPEVYTVSDVQGNLLEKRLQVIYNFRDIISDKYLFLTAIVNNSTIQILVLDTAGKVTGQSKINMDFETFYHVDMDLSRKGILSALLAGSSEAQVSWWRTDSLMRK